jgi:CHASE3 domain sensor protein
MQSLHSQTRDYLNNTVVPTINSMQDSITALNTALTALSESITTQNLYIVVGDKTYKITVEEGAVVPVEEVSNG